MMNKYVKPNWRGNKESWINLTKLMLIHICQGMDSTEAELSHVRWIIFGYDLDMDNLDMELMNA